MKKNLLFITVISFTSLGFTQITVANNNHVGIGTDKDYVPSATLEVSSNAQAGGESLFKAEVSDAQNDYLRIYNGTQTNGVFLPVIQGNVNSTKTVGLFLSGTTSAEHDTSSSLPLMVFDTRLNTGGSISNRLLYQWKSFDKTYMTMNSQGNLGLGIVNPDAILHTKGGIAIQHPTILYDARGDASNRAGIIFGSNHVTNNSMFWISPDETLGNRLNIGTGASYNDQYSKLTITNAGNVGVGTTNPAYKLQVEGSFSAHDIYSSGANSWVFHTPDTHGVTTMHIAPKKDGQWDWGNEIEFRNNSEVYAKIFRTHSGAILPADYVFEKYYIGESELNPQYTMPTLEEVEDFTKKHHHLPEIPSYKEVKEKGIDLGEMSNLLLQKIEELTLYTIEQNKLNQKQQKKIQELELKIQQLEKSNIGKP